ncbi:FAD-binding protein [Bifidobacterium psychraerophilum]|uniref:FAD-binding protein n=1 Tax=Bifidobacterium psychraerophilum TaxID=218140 RepID=UPI00311282F2
MTISPSFAQLTTIGVGGRIARFEQPDSRVGVIESVEDADSKGLPLCVIGGGSNMLVADEDFMGVVVRDARRDIMVLDEAAPVEGGDTTVHIAASAGANWDDLVEFSVTIGLEGIEGLSGIPGTVGASVVQNIGAYGQEVSSTVSSVEVWDREKKVVLELGPDELGFGYRTSALKCSMYDASGPVSRYFPTPRYVVLSVSFGLRHSDVGTVSFSQLAHALQVEVGARVPTHLIRQQVLEVRASKGMLEDPHRYDGDWMKGMRREENIEASLHALRRTLDADGWDRNRCSCGSFFMNPIIDPISASSLPENAPRFEARLADGGKGVKTSAAWLIDQAGFHKGYALSDGAAASLSTVHTLALTNRGDARAAEILELARTIRDGVRSRFGIVLVPEPVLIGDYTF